MDVDSSEAAASVPGATSLAAPSPVCCGGVAGDPAARLLRPGDSSLSPRPPLAFPRRFRSRLGADR